MTWVGGSHHMRRRTLHRTIIVIALMLVVLALTFSSVSAPVYALGRSPGPSEPVPQPIATHSPPTPTAKSNPAGKPKPSSRPRATAAPGSLLWSYTTTGATTAPVVVGGAAYVGTAPGYVDALNAATGSLLWSYQTGGSINASPAVVNGVVYVSANFSSGTTFDVYALNAASGTLLWVTQEPGGVDSSPIVANGIVYTDTHSGTGSTYALNAASGTLLWSYQTENTASSPQMVNDVVYIDGGGLYIYALDAVSGSLLWKVSGSDPVVDGGVLFYEYWDINLQSSFLNALNIANGTVLWSQGVSNYGFSITVANGVVYLGSTSFIFAFATNGARLWQYEAYGTFSAPIVVNSIMYASAIFSPGAVVALNAATGALLWRYQPSGSPYAPTVFNGVVYVATYQSAIDALNGATGALLWAYAADANPSPIEVNGALYTLSNTSNVVYALVASPPIQIPALGPTGTERYSGNPSELAYCYQCAGDPIDTYSGTFSHTFDDLNIPGRGLPLAFSHTYNAGAAASGGPLGYGWSGSYFWSLSFDGSGNATIQQENGSTVTFAPNGSSGGYTAPSRVLATFIKNSDGSYTYTRLQDQTHYTFSGSTHQLVQETDRNGYATTLGYNGSGQLTTVTDPAGRTLSFTYDANSHLTQISDPGSRTVAFSYDGNGNLASFTDVGGGEWHFTYDSTHLLLTMTDPRGEVTTNVYDSSGRVTSQTDAMNRTTSFSYASGSGGMTTTTMTDPKSNVTVDQYYNGLLLSETRGYGTAQAATWSYTYDPLSLGLASTTDPNGNTTYQTWDATGNLLSTTDPLGRTTTYTYDALNDLLTSTDPSSVTTTNTYNTHGNLLTTATPLVGTSQVQTTTYTYGDGSHPGDVTAMIDPGGQTWTYTYDAYGDRTTSTDPLGDKTTGAYNVLGEKTAETSAAGHTTSYTYDAFSDVLTTKDALGDTITNQYDGDRNLVAQTDPDGNLTQYAYDADNELTTVTRADTTTLQNGYDADGNQTSQADGNGHTTTYAYDPLNRLSSTTDPLSRTTSYGYDPAGNRMSLTNASNQTTSYSYDAANQLIGVHYGDGVTPGVTYTYDADGQRLSMTDGTGTTTYTYDSLHRLTASTNGAGAMVSDAYDLRGEITAITYPGSSSPTHTVTRTYDNAGRLASVTDWLGHTSTFTYDPDGNLLGMTYANGMLATRSYDAADRLTAIRYAFHPVGPMAPNYMTQVANFTYTRDALGLLTATTNSTVGSAPFAGQDQTNQYTTLNQLGSIGGYGTTTYAYDAGDNLITLGSATLSYDAADEVTKIVGSATTSYAYDPRGDRVQATTGSATVSLAYDEENHLTSYSASASGTTTSAVYAYNGDGLRMSKTVNSGSAEAFTWDTAPAEGLPLLLQDGSTAFVYGPNGTLLEQIAGDGTTLFAQQDQLGSTRLLTDVHGKIAATYTYDAYGNTVASTGTASTPLRFAGQYFDTDSGLYYLRARYYDPASAQFLTRDPLLSLTMQPYEYAYDNPLNGTDASGLWGPFDWAGAAWNAVSGFAAGAAKRASGLGKALAESDDPLVRSGAAGLLRDAGMLANSPVTRVLRGNVLGAVIGGALTVGGALASGASWGQAAAEAAGSTAGGLLGSYAGGLLCATAVVATAGAGLLACAAIMAAGAFIGGAIGQYAGDALYNFVTRARRGAMYETIGSAWGC